MEELIALKDHLKAGRYDQALALAEEMEVMSREDKINRVESYLDILLIHLIKKYAEKRSTRSWEASIHNAVRQIHKTNKRRKAGGYYLSREELADSIAECFEAALKYAAAEAFGGMMDETELARRIDPERIKAEALERVAPQPQAPLT